MPADRRDMRAYLQLMRFPAVFTAMADIVLGFVLAHRTLSPLVEFICLLGASAALYLAGMVFNDYFDRRVDASERPNRPIPSGRVSPRAALVLGTGLLVAGLSCALGAGGWAISIAGALTVLILAYDVYFKKTLAGPVAMGGCRLLNVLLGASALGTSVWKSPQIGVAAAMGIYVAGITWFARREAVTSSRSQLLGAALVIHGGIVLLIGLLFVGGPLSGREAQAVFAFLVVTASIEFPVARALGEPTPRNVQAAIKRLLLTIVLLDATMIYAMTGNPILAGGTALLVVPAATLGRWIFIT